MSDFKEDVFKKMLNEITKYTTREDAVVAIACGIKDNDIEEFTEYIKKIKDNDDEHTLLEKFITFCNIKHYDMNDEKEDNEYDEDELEEKFPDKYVF